LSSRNEPISQAHTIVGERIKSMMKHHQLSIPAGSALFQVGESTLIAYRKEIITIPYAVCLRVIAVLNPEYRTKMQFLSEFQHAVLEAWRNTGSKSSKNRVL
jgi:hypothetical protein